MAYNGSGTMVRVHRWTTDRDAAIKINADRMDEEDDGFATALSLALCSDGQSTATARIAFAQGIQLNGGAVGTPSVHFGDSDTGLWAAASNKVSVSCGGSKVGEFTTTGLAVTGALAATSLAVTGALAATSLVVSGGAIIDTVVALSDGATPALDASLGNTFTLTAAGNRTIAVPTNPVTGQKIVILHTASGADRTLALNSAAGGFAFGTDVTGLTATTSAKTDAIGCIYFAGLSKWLVVAYVKGYA